MDGNDAFIVRCHDKNGDELDLEIRHELWKNVEFTMGRSVVNNIVIPCIFISRFQCSLMFKDCSWRLYDKSSLKTTRLNGSNFPNGQILKDGDIINFDMTPGNWYYKFCFTPSVNEPIMKRRKLNSSDHPLEFASGSDDQNICLNSVQDTRKTYGVANIIPNDKFQSMEAELNLLRNEMTQLQCREANLKEECAEKCDEIKHKNIEISHLEEEIVALKSELNSKSELLLIQKEELERYKRQLQDTQETLVDAEEEILCLVAVTQVENKENSDQLSLDNLSSLRNDVALMEEKNQETSKLLIASMEENEAIRCSIKNIMESELTCSVCQDVFFKATTLNCKHTFCEYCIAEWKRRKVDCPVCRTVINNESKTILVDSVIDRLVDMLDSEMKLKRSNSKIERSVPQRQQRNGTTSTRGRRRVSRGHGRGRATGTRQALDTSSLSNIVHMLRHRLVEYAEGSQWGEPVVIDLTQSSTPQQRRNAGTQSSNGNQVSNVTLSTSSEEHTVTSSSSDSESSVEVWAP